MYSKTGHWVFVIIIDLFLHIILFLKGRRCHSVSKVKELKLITLNAIIMFTLFLHCNKHMSENTQKWHNQEALPSRGTKRRRDEDQTMKKQTSHIKPPITKTSLFKYTENFTTKKMKIFW